MDGDGSKNGHRGLRAWRLAALGAGMVLLVVLTPALAPPLVVQVGGITVEGNQPFVEHVGAALSLLEQKDPPTFGMVEQHVRRITQGRHSGMWAYEDPPRMEIGARTAGSSTTWLASAIAHDAMHSKLYADWYHAHGTPAPDETWTGVQAERICSRYEVEVLKRIGAPQTEIDWCSQSNGTHADVNGDGKLDWEDYARRNW